MSKTEFVNTLKKSSVTVLFIPDFYLKMCILNSRLVKTISIIFPTFDRTLMKFCLWLQMDIYEKLGGMFVALTERSNWDKAMFQTTMTFYQNVIWQYWHRNENILYSIFTCWTWKIEWFNRIWT